MAITIADKQNAIKKDLSDLKNKYYNINKSLQSGQEIPDMDDFNNSYLWGNGVSNFGIMDLIGLYMQEMTYFTGISTKGQDGATPMVFNKTNWENQQSLAVSSNGDGANGLWPTSSTSSINTSSPLLIQNGMSSAGTFTSFSGGSIASYVSNILSIPTTPSYSFSYLTGTTYTAEPVAINNASYFNYGSTPSPITADGVTLIFTRSSGILSATASGTATADGSISGTISLNYNITTSFATLINNYRTALITELNNYDTILAKTKLARSYIVSNYSSIITTADFNDTITASFLKYPVYLDAAFTISNVKADVEAFVAYFANSGVLVNYYKNRFTTLLSYIGADANTGLNKWRTFFINERIAQGTGSLSQKYSMVNLQNNTVNQIGSTTTQGSKLFAVSSFFGGVNNILPTQSVIAAFYNPAIDDNGLITSDKISIMWDGQAHAENYVIYRKTITNPYTDLNQATFTTPISTYTTLNNKGTAVSTQYNDTVANNTAYAYRVIMNDSYWVKNASTTPYSFTQGTNYYSDQSINLDSSISITTSPLTSSFSITTATKHSYSAGQIVMLNNGSNGYLFRIKKIVDDNNFVIFDKSLHDGNTISSLTGYTNCQLTYGVAVSSF